MESSHPQADKIKADKIKINDEDDMQGMDELPEGNILLDIYYTTVTYIV